MANYISSSSSSSAASVAEKFSWYCALFLLVLLLLDCCEPDEGELPIDEMHLTERMMNINNNNNNKVCDEIYVVEKGETLQTIIEKCGDPFIVEKNPHINDPDDIFPGFVLKITPNVSSHLHVNRAWIAMEYLHSGLVVFGEALAIKLAFHAALSSGIDCVTIYSDSQTLSTGGIPQNQVLVVAEIQFLCLSFVGFYRA
ncbi:hypothetical protein NE237_004136 [Protea cynaroides]|uniref:LysM domain-containing protein n=1 Tax=Protea cynaroides TaxID=273540 RepID=A0A9Q0QTB2_9MAGN|nr:hypothetical protein NE237_004136 [Protea cynaroides]